MTTFSKKVAMLTFGINSPRALPASSFLFQQTFKIISEVNFGQKKIFFYTSFII